MKEQRADVQILILDLPGIRTQVLGVSLPMFSHLCCEMTDNLGGTVLSQSRKLNGSIRNMPPHYSKPKTNRNTAS